MPKYEQNRNSAAIVPDQNVYWFVRSNEKSKVRSRPVAAAILQAVAEADAGRQAEERGGDDGEQADDDEDHDLHVGPGHRLNAAEHRVDHRRHRDRERRRRQVPAEHEREHDRRRRDDRAARHAARHQEQQAREAARLRVEPPLEVLVRGVDARLVEERHQRHRQDDHRQRQREVELDETQPVGVALSGRADHRDRAQLRGHHRDAGGPPGNAALGEEVALDLVAVLRALQAVVDDPGREPDDDGPVDRVHSANPPARRNTPETRTAR